MASATGPAGWGLRAGSGWVRSTCPRRSGRGPEPVDALRPGSASVKRIGSRANSPKSSPVGRAEPMPCPGSCGRGVALVAPIFSVDRSMQADRGVRETAVTEHRDGRKQGFSMESRREPRVIDFPAGTPESFLDPQRREPRSRSRTCPIPRGRSEADLGASLRGVNSDGASRREGAYAQRKRCIEASKADLRIMKNPKFRNRLPSIGSKRFARHGALYRRISA